ncbi:hypothetical protein [Rhizobacter sp. P5_C2]
MRIPRLCAAACLVVAACTPSLDWREVRPAGGGVLALFPCRPSQDARTVPLAGAALKLNLESCQAAGATFALSFTDVQDPARVAATIEALRTAAVGNLGGTPVVAGAAVVAGMTPNPLAQRVRVDGRFPDGSVVREELLFFVKGTVVYQATVLGARVDASAADAFFDGLKLAG